MKEFIDKLIERLEERKTIERAFKRSEYSHGVLYGYADAIKTIKKLAEEYKGGFCEWKQYDENDIYYTGCEQIHMFIDGSPTDNKYEYCPYCGKKIKVAPYTEGE